MISLDGLPLNKVLCALYHGTRSPAGAFFANLHDDPHFSPQDAREIVENTKMWRENGGAREMYIDYLRGRPIKMWFVEVNDGVFIDRADLYERDSIKSVRSVLDELMEEMTDPSNP